MGEDIQLTVGKIRQLRGDKAGLYFPGLCICYMNQRADKGNLVGPIYLLDKVCVYWYHF